MIGEHDVLAGLYRDAIREVRSGHEALSHGEKSGAVRALAWANRDFGMGLMYAAYREPGRMEYRATENRIRQAIESLTKKIAAAVTPRPRARRLNLGARS